MKNNPSISRIINTVLFILFTVLIFLSINPTPAHASGLNCKDSVSAGKENDRTGTASANVTNGGDRTPGYYPYAGSVHRQGVVIYIVKESKSFAGNIIADPSFAVGFMIHERTEEGDLRPVDNILSTSKGNDYGMTIFTSKYGSTLKSSNCGLYEYPTDWLPTPVTESGSSWTTQGKEIGKRLLETTTYMGEERPRWEVLILDYGTGSLASRKDVIEKLKSGEDVTLTLVIEPIAANCLYCYKPGDPTIYPLTKYDGKLYSMSYGERALFDHNASESEKQALKNQNLVVLGTPTGMAACVIGMNNSYTSLFNWKWVQYILPTSLKLEYDQLSITKTPDTSDKYPLQQIRSVNSSKYNGKVWGLGIGMFNDELRSSRIKTWDSSTVPGPTENPHPDKEGECIIKKLYYTKHTYSDGHVEFEDFNYDYVREGSDTTTQNITIVTETGYTLEGWKTSKNNCTFHRRDDSGSDDWDRISSVVRAGDSAGDVDLDIENNEKYLYILFRKDKVDAPEENTIDFEIMESQITRRVRMSKSKNSANVSRMVNTNFSWTAPSISCCVHYCGGWYCSGHRCSFTWDDNSVKLSLKNSTLASAQNKKILASEKYQSVIAPDYFSDTTIINGHNVYKKDYVRSGTSSKTLTRSRFNYIMVLVRTEDQLTLAKWKDQDGDPEFSDKINDMAQVRFRVNNTPNSNSLRKSEDNYETTFSIKFINGVNGENNVDTKTHASGSWGCSRYSYFKFNQEPFVINCKVKVHVFWAQNDSLEPEEISTDTGSPNCGKLAAGSFEFYPYVQMQYDTESNAIDESDTVVNPKAQYAFVLGQFKRKIELYDSVEVRMEEPTDGPNLQLKSNQWSTHASAFPNLKDKFGSITDEAFVKTHILPGGAVLSTYINKEDTHTIRVITVQACLADGSAGYKQVEATYHSALSSTKVPTSISDCEAKAEEFANNVRDTFSTVSVREFVLDTLTEDSKSVVKQENVVIPGQEVYGNITSTDSKYHFNNGEGSKLDTTEPKLEESKSKNYTFFVNTMGEIRCLITDANTVVPSLGISNNKTGTLVAERGKDEISSSCTNKQIIYIVEHNDIIKTFRNALLDNLGNDKKAGWVQTGTNEQKFHWYNEAFDGITFLYREYTFQVGYWNPGERQTVIDPKETPIQLHKGNYFEAFYSSALGTYNEDQNTADFTNNNGQSFNPQFDYLDLYYSKVYYLPNVTTQDLK